MPRGPELVTALVPVSLAGGPAAALRLLAAPALGAVEIARPPLDDLPYRDFVRTLLGRQGFKLDFNRMTPDEALALVSDQLLGPGAFRQERGLLASDIAELADFAAGLVGGVRPSISVRTLFAPGDLVWHLDRLSEPSAFRLLWPLGRPGGMRFTPADNVDAGMHRAYMRREHPLLCQLDARVLRAGADVETLWAHRPVQLEAMTTGRYPFLRDPDLEVAVHPDAASIHRVETGSQPGTYHRSSWANRRAPGFQIVITAASGPA
ncbi:hypothetical protein [Sphingomonas sp. M1-B02]|uniref:hypothetical protein n=1 Tax=Sphingomonas sp. M1-B02 TaxID=3114300 RepID=UPI002240378A|nr:hypothetical protein [Sphingomonas sp. S6-11]UZK66568.1 hypothetical protein OKW87_01630 [Sphingomonas sp. S6-11]